MEADAGPTPSAPGCPAATDAAPITHHAIMLGDLLQQTALELRKWRTEELEKMSAILKTSSLPSTPSTSVWSSHATSSRGTDNSAPTRSSTPSPSFALQQMSPATLEIAAPVAKAREQIATMEQPPATLVHQSLKEARSDLCRRTNALYGVGPKMLALIIFFWEHAEMICRAQGRYGDVFRAFRGLTQGGPLSPRIFNVLVDAIIREWLKEVLGEEASESGIGAAIYLFLALFYADDGYIASINEEMLQDAMDKLVDLFDRAGLHTNTVKTKAMTCVPGKIRQKLSHETYYNSRFGFHTSDEWQRRMVSCDVCDKQLQARNLSTHLETVHGVFRSKVINQDLLIDREPITYRPWPNVFGGFSCPVPGCGGEAYKGWNLRRHFHDRHEQDLLVLPGDGICYPKCESCGMQVNPESLARHERSKFCESRTERRVQREAAVEAARSLDVVFTAYDGQHELERVDVFRYLGRLMALDDVDTQAIQANMKKARKSWKLLSRLLRAEGASPRVSGMFYKAVVMAILLFSSETWNLTPTALKRLEGFHIRHAYRMAKVNKPRRNPHTGVWTYPASADVLEEVGLHTIAEYIEVQRQTIAKYIVDRPIFTLCMEEERRRGTAANRQWWWEQPTDWDLAREASASVVADD